MRQLLLGCGHSKEKLFGLNGTREWDDVVRLDMNPDCKPDIVWNLESVRPLPFMADEFDEIHAYEVLEHIGSQGDVEVFLRQFSDLWRILKPNGHIFPPVPHCDPIHAWRHPPHP